MSHESRGAQAVGKALPKTDRQILCTIQYLIESEMSFHVPIELNNKTGE